MGFLARVFGFERRAFRHAMNGVTMVKTALAMRVLAVCRVQYGDEYAYPLTGAVVNKVFSQDPSNELGQKFIEDVRNHAAIDSIIETAIRPHEDIRRVLTDALRTQCRVGFALFKGRSEADIDRLCVAPLRNLESLGLLIPGGHGPDLKRFLGDAGAFVLATKAIIDANNNVALNLVPKPGAGQTA